MDWDNPIFFSKESPSVKLDEESVTEMLISGKLPKPSIEQMLKIYSDHFSRLLRVSDKLGVPRNDVVDWLTEYIVWSEAEDFIER